MPDTASISGPPAIRVSPLVLSHELLALAERADRAGLALSATRLLELAHTVCTERPGRVAPIRRRNRELV